MIPLTALPLSAAAGNRPAVLPRFSSTRPTCLPCNACSCQRAGWRWGRYSRLDASALVLWVMAVATVIGGALWAGNDWAREAASARTGSASEVRLPARAHVRSV